MNNSPKLFQYATKTIAKIVFCFYNHSKSLEFRDQLKALEEDALAPAGSRKKRQMNTVYPKWTGNKLYYTLDASLCRFFRECMRKELW